MASVSRPSQPDAGCLQRVARSGSGSNDAPRCPVGADPFEHRADDHDAWYGRHRHAYRSELRAVRGVLGPFGRALEMGVGTGRFAAPLGIRFGVDPAEAMARKARERGITVVRVIGGRLPFRDVCFDRVLIALTQCFVRSPERALREARRVPVPEGRLVVAFLDPTSPPGRRYRNRSRGPFYEDVEFQAPDEVRRLLRSAGFRPVEWLQTLSRLPDELAGGSTRPANPAGRAAFRGTTVLPAIGQAVSNGIRGSVSDDAVPARVLRPVQSGIRPLHQLGRALLPIQERRHAGAAGDFDRFAPCLDRHPPDTLLNLADEVAYGRARTRRRDAGAPPVGWPGQ